MLCGIMCRAGSDSVININLKKVWLCNQSKLPNAVLLVSNAEPNYAFQLFQFSFINQPNRTIIFIPTTPRITLRVIKRLKPTETHI